MDSDYSQLLECHKLNRVDTYGRPVIKWGFTNIKGEHFSDIFSLNFTSQNIFGKLGIYRAETKQSSSNYFICTPFPIAGTRSMA